MLNMCLFPAKTLDEFWHVWFFVVAVCFRKMADYKEV